MPPSRPDRPRPERPWERRATEEQRLHRTYPAAEAAGLLVPGEELVAGRHPVEEALAARRPARRLLVVPQRREALERIVLHATTLRIPIVEVEGGTLTALAGFDGHQGVAVVLEERRFASLEDVLARAIERGEPPFILVLDSLEDPQNLGSLLRSAEAAGAHGVVFPIRRQAPLTPAAVKASAGAVEHLLLVPVDDLAGALADLHVRGVHVVGAEAGAALTHRDADLRGPLALVVGHEGQGLGSAVRRRCDLLVRIPMRGRIASLNAAVAGSILLFEASGQRGAAPEPAEPEPAEPEPAEPEPAQPHPTGPDDPVRDDAGSGPVPTAAAAGPTAKRAPRRGREDAPAPGKARVRRLPTRVAAVEEAGRAVQGGPGDELLPGTPITGTRPPRVRKAAPSGGAAEASADPGPAPAKRIRPLEAT